LIALCVIKTAYGILVATGRQEESGEAGGFYVIDKHPKLLGFHGPPKKVKNIRFFRP
jgi:hypothetical protein